MSTLWWAAYVAAVGLLAAAAARVLEPVVRALHRPTRWLWAAALGAQLAALAWAAGGPDSARPGAWFLAAWVALGVAAALVYLRAARVLRGERGSWRVRIAEDMPVWVSERTGPAVVGFVRSIVVAPEWALAMEDRERRLLLRHEAEHVAAWDPTLLLLGLVTCALVPWSPAAWWMLARLRLAIEVDCDRRVLRVEPDVAAYGELLVQVQGRVVPGAAGIAAFAERRLPLEERIEAMTARRPRGTAWRWGARGAVAGVLVLTACMVPCPRATIAAPSPHAERLLQAPELFARLDSTLRSPEGQRVVANLDSILRTLDGGEQARKEWAVGHAVERAFGVAGPPSDRAVGLVVAFDERWEVLDARAVALESLPPSPVVRARDRERLLPVLATHPAWTDGTMTSSGRFLGLAPRSQVYFWRRTSPDPLRDVSRLNIPWVLDRAAAALDAHFAEGAPRPAGVVTAWVLLDPRGAPLEVRTTAGATGSLNADTVGRHVPTVNGRQLEGFGRQDGEPFGLPTDSRVVWAMLMSPDDLRLDADSSRPTRKATRVMADSVRAYAERHGLVGSEMPVTVRVLLEPNNDLRGIVHGPLARGLPPDSVLAAFPGAAGKPWLRGGVMQAPARYGLPARSEIAWVQLAPPKVIRAVR